MKHRHPFLQLLAGAAVIVASCLVLTNNLYAAAGAVPNTRTSVVVTARPNAEFSMVWRPVDGAPFNPLTQRTIRLDAPQTIVTSTRHSADRNMHQWTISPSFAAIYAEDVFKIDLSEIRVNCSSQLTAQAIARNRTSTLETTVMSSALMAGHLEAVCMDLGTREAEHFAFCLHDSILTMYVKMNGKQSNVAFVYRAPLPRPLPNRECPTL